MTELENELPTAAPTRPNPEKRLQTIMLAFITLAMSWSFNSQIQMGKDVATIQTQVQELKDVKAAMQPRVDQLGLDMNKLRLDEDNTMFRVSYLENLKTATHATH